MVERDDRAALYHNIPVLVRERRKGWDFVRARFVRWLGNGRAAIIIFNGCWDGKQHQPVLHVYDPDRLRVSDIPMDPPELPAWARGPECPTCGEWPLEHHHTAGLWYCNRCLKDVSE